MQTRKASIKETGEELSQAEWERFDDAVAAARTERGTAGRRAVALPRDRLVSTPPTHAPEADGGHDGAAPPRP